MTEDTRIETRKITMCEECHYFDDCSHCYGNARFSCKHPDGLGGKLNQKIITKGTIHEECPWPKTKGV